MKEITVDDKLSIINNIINSEKVPHAILLEVDDCDSSMPMVKEIVKLILCKNTDKDLSKLNCSKCNICNLIDSNNYPDLQIISSDGNWIKKQQLVDLQNDFSNKSLFNNKRIYIIKEADKLNASSSNSLLKFLEEPEDDIIAILLTTNKYLLLDTILSRCQIFNLSNSDYNIDYDFLDKIETFVLYLIKKRNLFVDYKYLFDEVFIDKSSTKKLLNEVEKYFLNFLINNNDDMLKNSNTYNKLNDITIQEIISYVNIIEMERQKLEYNVNYKLWIDSFFSKIIGEFYDRCSCSYD